jgi:SnoaL-like protein
VNRDTGLFDEASGECATPRGLVARWRDALDARDPDAFAELFARDGVMVDVEHRTVDQRRVRPLEGRETIRTEVAAWFKRTASFSYEVVDALVDERAAAARWRYVVDGREFEGLTWLDCVNGEIQRAYVYFDSHAFLLPR